MVCVCVYVAFLAEQTQAISLFNSKIQSELQPKKREREKTPNKHISNAILQVTKTWKRGGGETMKIRINFDNSHIFPKT